MAKRKPKAGRGPQSEASFTRQVIALARLAGFRVAHFRPARTATGWRTPCQGDAKGFPDILCVRRRDGRMLAAELKVGRGRATAEQQAWLDDFRAAGVPVYLWRPADWPKIEGVFLR